MKKSELTSLDKLFYLIGILTSIIILWCTFVVLILVVKAMPIIRMCLREWK